MSLVEPQTRHFSREEYYQMAGLGYFDGQKVELLDGEIVEMPPQKDPHGLSVTKSMYALVRAFPPTRATVRVQLPMRIGRTSDPEPDLVVVAGGPHEQTGHPTTALLVIEVSETSLPLARGRKLEIYANAGIEEYWIVNLIDRALEVYRHPARGADGTARYGAAPIVLKPGENVSPLAAAAQSIAVADLLP